MPDTVLVQVDGGISADNAREVCDAGADLLVAGSAVFWQDDPGRRLSRRSRAVCKEARSMTADARRRPDDHVIVLFGATGDLARRKLFPGLFNLHCAG